MSEKKRPVRAAALRALFFVALAGLAACNQQDARDATAPAATTPSRVTVEQVAKWMDEGEALVFIDSRSGHAWEAGATKARGAVRVPPDDIEPYLDRVPRDGRLIVYCT